MNSNLNTLSAPLLGGSRSANRIAGFATEAFHRRTSEPAAPVFRNREYNRALRQAELAAWEFGKPAAKRQAESLATLGAQQRESGAEKVMYALLTILCAVAIGFALVDSAELLNYWDAFVRGVRTLLG